LRRGGLDEQAHLHRWRLEVEVGRHGVNRRRVGATTGSLFRRALSSACVLGLPKDDNFGDFVLHCRYVRTAAEGLPNVHSSAISSIIDGGSDGQASPGGKQLSSAFGTDTDSTHGNATRPRDIRESATEAREDEVPRVSLTPPAPGQPRDDVARLPPRAAQEGRPSKSPVEIISLLSSSDTDDAVRRPTFRRRAMAKKPQLKATGGNDACS
jgi:hypothetical protein